MTLKELFNTFAQQAKWHRFAIASTQPMLFVMRKIGNTDIEQLTRTEIEKLLTTTTQSTETLVKARACLTHMLTWAKQQGFNVCTLQTSTPAPVAPKPKAAPTPKPTPAPALKPKAKAKPKAKRVAKTPKPKAPEPQSEPKPEPEPKPTSNPLTRKWNSTRQPVQELTLTDALFPGEKPISGTRNVGCVYQDTYSKGIKNNHRTYHNRWVAEIQIGGVHFRHRSADKNDCEAWLKAVRNGRISPRDYGADWYLVEQRRDMEKRFEEMILSAAEEAMLAAQYTADKNLKPISDYMTQRLLPHMIYYCAHVLNMGRKTALDASTQCIAIMLENIAAGKPITNFTRYGKRMLRVRKAHRDFWYYEKVPQNIRLIIDGIDYKPLEEIYKLTKLKKI
jgi:outer membrane biosynthesis protein TonB